MNKKQPQRKIINRSKKSQFRLIISPEDLNEICTGSKTSQFSLMINCEDLNEICANLQTSQLHKLHKLHKISDGDSVSETVSFDNIDSEDSDCETKSQNDFASEDYQD